MKDSIKTEFTKSGWLPKMMIIRTIERMNMDSLIFVIALTLGRLVIPVMALIVIGNAILKRDLREVK